VRATPSKADARSVAAKASRPTGAWCADSDRAAAGRTAAAGWLIGPRLVTVTQSSEQPHERLPMADPILIPDATSEPAAYVAALLHTLGDRDPLQVYEHTAEQVRRHCQDLDQQAWTTPMAEGEWSTLQLVGHLFDVDVVYGFRWRLALTEDTPAYPGYDEKAWSQLARPTPPQLLDALAGLRLANAALLRSFGERELRRRGIHGEQGSEDVQRMIDKVAGHDLAHLDQLRRTIAAVRSGTTTPTP
jgi:hypothetical protein